MPETRLTLTIPPALDGQRLDRALAELAPELSRSRLKSLIDSGQVSLDGKAVMQPSAKVAAGQTFAIVVAEPSLAEPVGQDIALDILFEDEEIVVLNKPAGLVVHPGPGNPDHTLVNALIAHCGASLKGIGGVLRPGIVHRLDKETSGVMVTAKTEQAHQDLVRQFAERQVERAYGALVWGRPSPPRGEITGNIGRSPKNRKKMAVLRRGGRPATTRYRVLQSFGGGLASHLECRLLTGRTHQIRVHLSERGHPVMGDPLYGRARAERVRSLSPAAREALKHLDRQALHARTLAFTHPTTGDRLEFVTKYPPDIKGLIDCLEEL
jgi:23S rRNA pseudouridine1911/1915/1917 synthase